MKIVTKNPYICLCVCDTYKDENGNYMIDGRINKRGHIYTCGLSLFDAKRSDLPLQTSFHFENIEIHNTMFFISDLYVLQIISPTKETAPTI